MRMHRLRRTGGCVLVGWAVACGPVEPPASGVDDEVRVETLGESRTLSLEIGQLRSGTLDATTGYLLLLDSYEPLVTVFDPAGDSLVFRGGTGRGPGEFTRPVAGGWTSAGPWVLDYGNDRVTQLDRGGRPVWERRLDEVPLPSSVMSLKPTYLLEGGDLLALPSYRSADVEGAVASLPVGVVDSAGQLTRLPDLELGVPSTTRIRNDRGVTYASPLFDPEPIFAPIQNGGATFVVVTRVPRADHTFSVGLGSSGGIDWTRVAYDPLPTGPAIERMRERIEGWIEGGSSTPFTADEYISSSWIPDHQPPILSVVPALDGVWLERPSVADATVWEWFSFTSHRVTRRLQLPGTSSLIGETPSTVVLSIEDELGVTSLVVVDRAAR